MRTPQSTSNDHRTPLQSPRMQTPQVTSNDHHTPDQNRTAHSGRITPPTSPFIAPARRRTFVYSAPFNSPRTSLARPRQDSIMGNVAPAPTVAQSFSQNEGTQPRDAEPYIYIPMPSPPASPEQPQREGRSNILDVAPGLRAGLDRNAQRGRGRGRNRVTRGNRRGRGRGTSRGRITVGCPCQGPGARLSRAEDPSAGCKTIPSCTAELMLERDYVNTYVSQGARLFCSAAMERLAVELDVKNLNRKRSHVFVLLCDEVVGKCCEWLKEFHP